MWTLTPMTPEDWPAVRDIYEQGIATRNATFETSPPEWAAWNAKHLELCRIVARRVSDGQEIIGGWAALSPVSSRPVYAGVAEVSVYVAASARGQGMGGLLLGALVRESELAGIWTLQASIFPENEASLHLHAKLGFRVVGRRERIARLEGAWRDTVFVERRSGLF